MKGMPTNAIFRGGSLLDWRENEMKTIKKFSLVGAVAVAMFAFSACDDSSSAGGDETETSALSSSAKVTEPAEVTSSSSENVASSNSGKQSESSSSSAGKVNCSALLEGKTGWSWDVPKECRFNPVIDYGSMTDERDGKKYKTVTIGDEVWMAENLNYADSVKTASLKGKSWCYNNVAKNCDVTGRLYTWAAAMDSVKTGCGYGSTCSPTLPVQGICPTGWHLPDTTEWNTLFTAVGGRSTAGKVLKSQSGWYRNRNGTDTFGYSALPAGYSGDIGGFYGDNSYASFWSSTESGSYRAYIMYLFCDLEDADLYIYGKDYGFSVRCLKDSE